MKRYEFHSALPPELVFAIVSTKAKETRFPYLAGTSATSEGFFYRRDGERLWLTCTRTIRIGNFVPFSATVRAEGTGSVISGRFFVRTLWAIMAAGFGFVCLMMLMLDTPPVLAVIMPILWILLCVRSFTLDQAVLFKKRQQAVLGFIQQHLLE